MITTTDELIHKLFPGLDAHTRERLVKLLPSLETAHELRDFVHAKHPKAAQRQEAEAFVLRRLVGAILADEPFGEIPWSSVTTLVKRGQGPHAAHALLASHDRTEVLAVLEALGPASAEAAELGAAPSSRRAEVPLSSRHDPRSAAPPSLPRKEKAVPISAQDFAFDQRNLPDTLKTKAAQDAYVEAVKAAIKLRGADPDDAVLTAAVVGGLLRQSQFNPRSSSLPSFVARILDDLLLQRGTPQEPFNALQVYKAIADVLNQKPAGNGRGVNP